MPVAGIGLGANLGDPARQLAMALQRLACEVGDVQAVSSLWRSAPWGVADQPAFLNACALLQTELSPFELLAACKRIERDGGRTAGPRWGPRPIDLDILFYEDLLLATPNLTLPHESMFVRGFVLAPLTEIAGERIVGGQRIADALARVDRRGLERLDCGSWPPPLQEKNRMGEWIALMGAGGVEISAWRAAPNGTPKGGVVVLQEIFGVNAHIRSVAEGFARDGYLAVAPALFDRVERGVELGYDGSDMERARDLRAKTKLADTLQDIAAAVTAAGKGGAVGVVGYCWGGSLAWACAADVPGIAAAVGYYGGMIAGMLDRVPRVPVALHFGARDQHIPLSDVEKIREAFPAVPVYVYDADHGFNCDARASHDTGAARVARERTMAFFADHLRGNGDVASR